MGFVRFTDKSGREIEPIASIQKSGKIVFNMPAMREFKITDYEYAVLFFNKETNQVGVMFTNKKDEPGAYRLIRPKNGGWSLAARKFLRVNKIDFSKTRKCPLKLDEESELYVFTI